MVVRYRDGNVPQVELDPALGEEIDVAPAAVCRHLDGAQLTPALEAAWQPVRRLNRYVEEQAPWVLAKDPRRAGDLDRTLASLVEGLRVVAVVLLPWLPDTMGRLLDALGARDRSLAAARYGAEVPTSVERLAPLFPKVEQIEDAA
jgi:methionyl-tRNA synthetase